MAIKKAGGEKAPPKKSPASEKTDSKTDKPWLFKKGQSGNLKGRPKGARQKLDTEFVAALLKDFTKSGSTAITKCREEKPEAYLSVITKVLPKIIEGTVDHDHKHAHTTESVSETAEWLAGVVGTGSGRKAKKPVSH